MAVNPTFTIPLTALIAVLISVTDGGPAGAIN
jgi:hypothetical protein